MLMTSEQADAYMDLLRGPIEPLHPDLEDAIYDAHGWTVLNHPLIQTAPYFPQMNAVMNRGYAQKLEALERARVEKRYERIVTLHEKPYQIDALLEVEPFILRNARWWKLVRRVWQQSDNIHQKLDEWRSIWIEGRPDIGHVMDHDERARLRTMPRTFTVWRGSAYGDYAQNGLSWTLSKEQAVWFANRFADHQGRPMLAEGVVDRDRVLALFDGGEQEVVLDPDELLDLDVAPATRVKTHQPGAWKV
jgi:hypothetical protein